MTHGDKGRNREEEEEEVIKRRWHQRERERRCTADAVATLNDNLPHISVHLLSKRYCIGAIRGGQEPVAKKKRQGTWVKKSSSEYT